MSLPERQLDDERVEPYIVAPIQYGPKSVQLRSLTLEECERVRTLAPGTSGGDAYYANLARRLFGPVLLGGRELPQALDLAFVIGFYLNSYLLRLPDDVLEQPILIIRYGEPGLNAGEMWRGTAGRVFGGDFSVDIDVDGDPFRVDCDGLQRWAQRLRRIIWPAGTHFGFLHVPDLITCWNVDLASVSTNEDVTAATKKLVLRPRRRLRFYELDPADQKAELQLVAFQTMRSLDPLCEGLIVRRGAFKVPPIPRVPLGDDPLGILDQRISRNEPAFPEPLAPEMGADPVGDVEQLQYRTEHAKHFLLKLASGLPLKQRRILKLLVQHEGDRKAVARRLRIAPESVDRAVHRMRVAARGRK